MSSITAFALLVLYHNKGEPIPFGWFLCCIILMAIDDLILHLKTRKGD